jgi:hypothetical protein
MAIVIFRSSAAADVMMFAANARHIFEIIGRPESSRGVITAEQVPDALRKLTAAVEQEKVQLQAMLETPGAEINERQSVGDVPRRGGMLSRRAFPLIEMLREAQRRNTYVTWGV